jgi:hypothetical protein
MTGTSKESVETLMEKLCLPETAKATVRALLDERAAQKARARE